MDISVSLLRQRKRSDYKEDHAQNEDKIGRLLQ